ncbi:hypothetical protein P261_00205 [Lachnospiraceae bacterium TWA4]|nr:hypothetical protein P261_00205 [Lachnospiraceae bacterium TWA4]
MDPKKEAFLKEILNSSGNQKEMLPFIMSMITKAKSEQINFSTEEAMMLFNQMGNKLSPSDQNRLMQLFKFMQSKGTK